MEQLLNQLFLTIRLGGLGMTSSVDTRDAAYVASLLQCTAPIAQQLSITELPVISGLRTAGMVAFQDSVSALRSRGITCLDNICIQTLWTTPAQTKMQGKIASQLQQLRRRKEINSLPVGVPRNGIAALQPLSVNDAAIRRQGITNCTCPDSGQFLLANAAHFLNRMINLAFTLSIQLRLKLPVMGSRTHCDNIAREVGVVLWSRGTVKEGGSLDRL